MGDTQSAPRESAQDSVAAAMDDVRRRSEELLKSNGRLTGEPDGPLVGAASFREDDIPPSQESAILSQAEEVLQKPPEEADDITVTESSKKANQKADGEAEAKRHDISESFKNFFSKFVLMFTLKRTSSDHAEIRNVPETNTEEAEVEDASDKTEQTPTQKSDSICPPRRETEEALKKHIETKEAHKPSVDYEWTHLDTVYDQCPASSTQDDVSVSPFKRFFTTGFFSGIRKKSLSEGDENSTRDLVQGEAKDTEAKLEQEKILFGEAEMSKETENVVAGPPNKLDVKPSEDQVFSSTDLPMNPKNPPELTEAEKEESAWVTFKKLLSPKKHSNQSRLHNKDTETLIPNQEEEKQPSLEETKNRKDSTVSCDAGSGRRSLRPSDSDEETPRTDHGDKFSNGVEATEINPDKGAIPASAHIQAGIPADGNGESPWNVLKRLLSPKRKPVSHDSPENSLCSANILHGHKKRKSVTKEVQEEPETEADQDLILGDFQFDTIETDVKAKETDVESQIPNESNQDILDQVAEPEAPSDDLLTVDPKVQYVSENEAQVPVEVSKFISKQLSDIPEESEMTKTTATAESAPQDLSREVPAAEDMISDAFPPPEPTDDGETEMISVLSRISESSKTSGDMIPERPVPAESEVMETEDLLMVETISTTPEVVPLISSASDQILELLVHQVEACSTETTNQNPNEDFVTTKMKVEEATEADPSRPSNPLNRVDSSNEVRDHEDRLSDVNRSSDLFGSQTEASIVASPEGEYKEEELDQDTPSLLKSINQLEFEDLAPALDEELQRSAELEDDTKDTREKTKQETAPSAEPNEPDAEQDALLDVSQLVEVTGASEEHLPEALTEEPEPPTELSEPEVHKDSFADCERSEKVHEELIAVENENNEDAEEDAEMSDCTPEGRTVQGEETAPVTKTNAAPDNQDQQSVNVSKNQISQEIEPAEDVEATEGKSDDVNVLAIKSTTETEVLQEDTMPLPEDNIEVEDTDTKEPEFELIQELNILGEPQLESGEVDVQAVDNKVVSEDVLVGEHLTEESKEPEFELQELNILGETQFESGEVDVQAIDNKVVSEDVLVGEHLTEESKEPEFELIQELNVLGEPQFESSEVDVQAIDNKVVSEDILVGEHLTEESKEPEFELIQELNVLGEPQFESGEVDVPVIDNKVVSEDVLVGEHLTEESKEPEFELNQELNVLGEPQFESGEVDVQAIDNKVVSEDVLVGEHLTEESKEPEFELIQELNVLGEPQFESGEVDVQAIDNKVVSEDILVGEHLTEESKEPEFEPIQELNVLGEPQFESGEVDVQAIDNKVVSEDVLVGEHLTEESKEPEFELIQELNVLGEPQFESSEVDVQAIDNKVVSEDILVGEHLTEESKEPEFELIQELNVLGEPQFESGEVDVPVIDNKVVSEDVLVGEHLTEESKEPEFELNQELNVLGEPQFESGEVDVQAIDNKVVSEDVLVGEHLTEESKEPEFELIQELNVLGEPQFESGEVDVQAIDNKVVSEDILVGEHLTEESKEPEFEPIQELNVLGEPQFESGEVDVQAIDNKVVSEDVLVGEHLTEESKEPEFELIQKLNVLGEPQFKSGEVDVQAIDNKVVSEDVLVGEHLTEESKEPEFELIQELNVLGEPQFESSEVDVQAIDNKVVSEDILVGEHLTEESKEPETKPEPKEDHQTADEKPMSEGTLVEDTVKDEVQNRNLPLSEFGVTLIKEEEDVIEGVKDPDQADVKIVSHDNHLHDAMAEESKEETGPIVEKDASKNDQAESRHTESDEINIKLLKSEEAIFAEETKTEEPKKEEVVKPENEDQNAVSVIKTELGPERVLTGEEEETSDDIEKTLSVREMNVEAETQDQEAANASKKDTERPEDAEVRDFQPDDANVQAMESKTVFSNETFREDLSEDTAQLDEDNVEVESKDTKDEVQLIREKVELNAAQDEVDVQTLDNKSEDILSEKHVTEEPKEETETKVEAEEDHHESQTNPAKEVEVAEVEVNEEMSEGEFAEETVKVEVKDRTLTEFSVELMKDEKNVEDAATIQLIPEHQVTEAVEDTHEVHEPFTEVSDGPHPEKTMAVELQEMGPLVEEDASEAQSTQSDSDEIPVRLLKSEEAKLEKPKEEQVPPTANVEDQKAAVGAQTELAQGQAVAEEDEEISEGSPNHDGSVPIEGTVPGTENNVQPEDQDKAAVEILKSEKVDVLKSEEISDDLLAMGNTIGQIKEELEPPPEDSPAPESIDEAAVNSNRTAPESKENKVQSVQRDVTAEGSLGEKILSGQEATTEDKPEDETLLEETPRPEKEKETLTDFHEVEAQKTETDIDDFKPEEFHTPEITEELDAFAAEHVSPDKGETSSAQIFEHVVYEVIPTSCGDLDVRLNDVGTRTEDEEGDLRKAEVRTRANVHALVMQVTTFHLKDVSASVEKTSAEQEQVISSFINESEKTKTVTETQRQQAGNEVVTMHLPATLIKGNPGIPAQVVDVNPTTKDDQEVINVCHGSVEKLSAVLEVEEVSNEGNVPILQEVHEHAKRTQSETLPESGEPDKVKILAEAPQEDIPQSFDVSVQGEKNKDYVEKTEVRTEDATFPSVDVPANNANMDTTAAGTFQNQTLSLSHLGVATNLSLSEQEKTLSSIKTTTRQNEEEPLVTEVDEEVEETTLNEDYMSKIYTEPTEGSHRPDTEHHLSQTDLVDSHKDLEMAEECEPVEEEPLSQIDTADVTHKVVQVPGAVSEAVGIQQQKEETEDIAQHPVAEKPLTQMDHSDSLEEKQIRDVVLLAEVFEKPSSQVDTVQIEHPEVTRGRVQAMEETLSQKTEPINPDPVDNQKKVSMEVVQIPAPEAPHVDTSVSSKQAKLTEISVAAPEAKALRVITDTIEQAKERLSQMGSLCATGAEDFPSEPQPDTDLNEVGFQAPGTEEQTELPQEDAPGTYTEEPLAQMTKLTEKAVHTQDLEKSLALSEKDTALPEHIPEAGEAIPQTDANIHEQAKKPEEAVQMPETEESILVNDPADRQKPAQTEEHVQEPEPEKPRSQTDYVNTHKETYKPEEAVQTAETEESSSAKDPADSQKQTALMDEHARVPEAEESMLKTESVNIYEKAPQPEECVQAKQTEEYLSQNDIVQNQKRTDLTKEHVQEPKVGKVLSGTVPFESHKEKVLTEEHVKALQADESMAEESPLNQAQTKLSKEQPGEPQAEESSCQIKPIQSQKLEHDVEESLSKTDAVDSQKQTVLPQGCFQDPELEESLSQIYTTESHPQVELAEEHVPKQEEDKPLSLTDSVEREKESEHVMERETPSRHS
uniref:titin-like n=1 Tax=Doryrhamphus excisus TaxID=161450 RepID=UPI0025ADEDB9|nr:titin-like [Doryrhamphus excisus]